MQDRGATKYISGIKGLGCFLVTVGHFSGIAKYISAVDGGFSNLSFLLKGPIAVFFNEQFWLQQFFMASGFILALGSIKSLSELIQKTIRRFLRLGLPILFACACIYLLWISGGMRNAQTAALFENTWYQTAYNADVGIKDVLLSPIDVLIHGKYSLNPPYWVLKDMFVASILIYISIYAQTKLSRFRWAPFVCAYGCVAVSLLLPRNVTVCVLGFVLNRHRSHAKRFMETKRWIGLVIVAVFGISAILRPNVVSAVLLFGSVLLLVPYFQRIERVLCSRVLMGLEKLSFGIYSLHWPIACSAGACVLMWTWELGPIWAMGICAVVSFLITIPAAYLFNATAERGSAFITEKLMKAVSRIADGK